MNLRLLIIIRALEALGELERKNEQLERDKMELLAQLEAERNKNHLIKAEHETSIEKM